MKPIIINPTDLQNWLKETWHLYASQSIDGNKLLRFWVNGLIEYKVVYENEILYQGSQMTHAITAWESV